MIALAIGGLALLALRRKPSPVAVQTAPVKPELAAAREEIAAPVTRSAQILAAVQEAAPVLTPTPIEVYAPEPMVTVLELKAAPVVVKAAPVLEQLKVAPVVVKAAPVLEQLKVAPVVVKAAPVLEQLKVAPVVVKAAPVLEQLKVAPVRVALDQLNRRMP